ncbi:MAG: hypothetical protein AAGF93_08245 [Cyanobacteria bacterium P01_H01_bin.105]
MTQRAQLHVNASTIGFASVETDAGKADSLLLMRSLTVWGAAVE